jgi:hypothetical protein
MNMSRNHLRELGAMETRMALMHREMQGTNQGCQICTLEGDLGNDEIRAAARSLFDDHQALRCVIVDQGDALVFQEHGDFDRIDLEERSLHADADPRVARDGVFEDELNRPLDAGHALWRMVILRGPTQRSVSIVITCHHAIVDGLASFALIEDLLRRLDEPGRASQGDAPLAPAIDEFLLPARPTQAAPASPSRAPLPFRHFAEMTQRRTRNEYVVLDAGEHEALKQRASAERLTVNSMLGAALAGAALDMGLVADPAPLKSAVSLRHVAPETARLGCYISVADTALALAPAAQVVARQYETQLFMAIGRHCMRRSPVQKRAVSDAIQRAKDSRSFEAGIGLTFPGTIAMTTHYRQFRVTAYNAAANRVGGNLAVVATVISFDGALTLGLAFVDPLIDRSTVRALGDAIRARLIQPSTEPCTATA